MMCAPHAAHRLDTSQRGGVAGDAPKKTPKTGWSPERRAKQAALMRRIKPWEKSTGPKSAAGKARSRYNAYKHGNFSAGARAMNKVLKEHRQFLKSVQLALKQVALEEKLKKSQNELLARPRKERKGAQSPPRNTINHHKAFAPSAPLRFKKIKNPGNELWNPSPGFALLNHPPPVGGGIRSLGGLVRLGEVGRGGEEQTLATFA